MSGYDTSSDALATIPELKRYLWKKPGIMKRELQKYASS